jgi:cytidylate kinase
VSPNSNAPFVVALDGPAASGKSTVGLESARRLGFFYLDTGLLYRAITLAALRAGVDPADPQAMADLARRTRLDVRPPTCEDGRQVDLLLDGDDVTWAVREPEVDANVSAASAHAEVRDVLRQAQRGAIRAPGTILAGRDIGTVIAPEAPLTIWLTASAEERARRRSTQTGEEYEEVLASMIARDRRDGTRTVAPMQKASDAVEINSDHLSPDEVIAQIVLLAHERGA